MKIVDHLLGTCADHAMHFDLLHEGIIVLTVAAILRYSYIPLREKRTA